MKVALWSIVVLGVLGMVSIYNIPVQAAGPRLSTALTQDSQAKDIQLAATAQLWDGSALSKTANNLALTSNVVTITTSAAHGYAVGQRVTVTLTGPTPFSDVNGTFVITVVGSSTTFSYAFMHANISTGAATGSTVAYQLSPTPTGTTQVTFVFPQGAFGMVIIPLDATDATMSYTTSGGIGGTFPLYQNVANFIAGTEGDTVYIQRTTTTKLAFLFAMGK